MQVTTALQAVRVLGVDVANLSARCAVYQSASEGILEVADRLRSLNWNDVEMPIENREALQLLLLAVEDLR